MIPGNSRILTCPHCGSEKKVLSLVSGNTFGAEIWSDNKMIAKMLPEVSAIQKCPHCGKYYFTARQEVRYDSDDCSFEQGLLSFAEMKGAFSQLSQEGFRNIDEESTARMMLFHAYNDYYVRSGGCPEVSQDDHVLFCKTGEWLIDNLIQDDLLKAEFYREIGQREKALELLVSYSSDDVFLCEVVAGIRTRLEKGDDKVFRIR